MAKLKLVMAVSKDGIVSLGPEDDMLWTGHDDKRAFRLLTHSGGALGAGRRTFERLPKLKGRTVVCLSTRRGMVPNFEARRIADLSKCGPEPVSSEAAYESTMTLGQFAHANPDGWLIGGQTVALEALSISMLDLVVLCRAPIELHLSTLFDPRAAQLDRITPFMRARKEWAMVDSVPFGETRVEFWRRRP